MRLSQVFVGALCVVGFVAAVAMADGKCGTAAAATCGDNKAPQCGTGGTCPIQKTGAPAADAKTQDTCPVMGGKINKKIFADYEGKRVYFCCGGCIKTFQKDPAKYVKDLESKGITLDKTPDAKATPVVK